MYNCNLPHTQHAIPLLLFELFERSCFTYNYIADVWPMPFTHSFIDDSIVMCTYPSPSLLHSLSHPLASPSIIATIKAPNNYVMSSFTAY